MHGKLAAGLVIVGIAMSTGGAAQAQASPHQAAIEPTKMEFPNLSAPHGPAPLTLVLENTMISG